MSGDFTQVCVPSGSGGSGINLDALPPLPDPELLDAQVQSMIAAGVGFHEGVQDAARNWSGLRAFYRTPESEQVLGAFTPVLAKSGRVRDLTGAAARALYAYSDRARDLKRRITSLRAEVEALDAVILANDDWHTKNQIVDTHQRLMSSASRLAQQILDSDTQCANQISALSHGPGYAPVQVPRRTMFDSTDQLANGFSALQHQLGTDAGVPDVPWGPSVSIRYEGYFSGLQGFGTAAVGSIQGLYTLFGTRDKDAQGQAWQGIGALGVAVFRAKAVIDRGFTDMDTGDIEALLTAGAAIKDTVHADEWATDPWRAAGQTIFDAATAAAGAVGGGLSVEARIAALAARLRGLPTKTPSVAEAGAAATALTEAGTTGTVVSESAAAAFGNTAAKSSAVLGSATAAEWAKGFDAGIARIQEYLTAARKTIDDFAPTPATAGIPTTAAPSAVSSGPGPITRWLNEHHNTTREPVPAPPRQSKGLWSEQIDKQAKTTPTPETGPKPSGINEARLKQRFNPTTHNPTGVPDTHPEPPGAPHTQAEPSAKPAGPSEASEHAPEPPTPMKAPGPAGTYDQRLGDHTLPGRHPDLQPTIGDTDGGPGVWAEPAGRSPNGVADQTFATGVTATGPKGNPLEYFVVHHDVIVEFDGHLWRGRPPVEVFQEIKGNYSFLTKPFFQKIGATEKMIGKWIDNQLSKQVAALPSGARLEWIFTANEELAMQFRRAVRRFGYPVDVKFIPLTK